MSRSVSRYGFLLKSMVDNILGKFTLIPVEGKKCHAKTMTSRKVDRSLK